MSIEHIKLAVPLQDLLRLKPFISTEGIRFYLNGIRFEQGSDGVLLVATDGHRLGVFRSTEALASCGGIVRLPEKLPKLDRRDKRAWLIVGEFGGTELALIYQTATHSATAEDIAAAVGLKDADLIYARPLIEADFPNWRRVLPAKVGPRIASFNSRYLADFATVTDQTKRGAAITLHGDGLGDPHVVMVGGECNFIGVQMPMRADGLDKFPDWLAKPKAPKRRKVA